MSDLATRRPTLGRRAFFMTNYLDDILAICGAALITAGAAWIYPPAGLIIAGLFCIVAALIYGRFLSVSAETDTKSES